MRDKALGLLGLMRRAGAIEPGADRSCETARSGKARLLVLASDVSENARAKAENALAGKSAPLVELPFTRDELSDALGIGDCTMAAITDMGFAEALMKQLSALDAARYAAPAAALSQKREKMLRRKTEKGRKGQGKTNGMRRTTI